MKTSMKKLLILDLNGVLFSKVGKGEGNFIMENNTNYDLLVQDDMIPFLQKCEKLFDIAIWSSTTEKNAIPMIQYIEKYGIEFKFVWFRDRTQLNPFYLINPKVKKYDTIKDIRQVLLSPEINRERRYTPNDILIVDDEYNKVRMNKHFIIAKHSSRNGIDYAYLYSKISKFKNANE